jgi:tetratricopeptide (TPR) repeat protein
VARRGAGELESPRPDSATAEWRKAVQRARDGNGAPPPAAELEPWIDEGVFEEDEAGRAPGRGEHRVDVALSAQDRRKLAATGKRGATQEQRIKDAAKAFRAERFDDARRILKDVSELAPQVATVRELYGLTLYRLRRWRLAAAELEAFRDLTGSTEQHPVLADCYRALKQHARVAELWDELRQASPSAELVTEGRIVMAGSLADQGKLKEALAVLGQRNWRLPRQPKDHHLRRAYALADLLERAGETTKARDLFARIQRADPRFADVGRRVKAL